MIETRINSTGDALEGCKVVTEITPGMILEDLANGLDRKEIAQKYAYNDPTTGETRRFEDWMVETMFKHPLLKGKKAAKIKRLPFIFKAEGNAEAGIHDLTTTPTAGPVPPVQENITVLTPTDPLEGSEEGNVPENSLVENL